MVLVHPSNLQANARHLAGILKFIFGFMKAFYNTIAMVLGLGLVMFTASSLGQFAPVIDPSLLKFFPENVAFSATMEIQDRDYEWPIQIVVSEGMTRAEADSSKIRRIQRLDAWENYVSKMQQAGLAKSVSIFNPKKRAVYNVVPEVKSYFEKPIEEAQIEQLKTPPKGQVTDLGTELVDGRLGVKKKVVFASTHMDVWRTWESSTAIIWTAKDLPNVLLRLQVMDSSGATNTTLVFKDVKLKTPKAGLFLPPKGFKKTEEKVLMEEALKKLPKEK